MNVLITGATSGLGLALKQKFEADGHTVINLSRTATGENAYACDIAKPEDIQKAFVEIAQKFDNIDILINNAGIALAGVTELLPDDEVKKIFDVNFFGLLKVTQKTLPLMKEGGKIINISSPCGDFALPFRTMYCVTKSAVSMLSYCLKLELETAKIQVSAICPGNIFTNLSKNRVKFTDTNERYGDAIEKATEKINKEANNRMSLDYVSKKIYKIIAKNKLKSQYVIGKKYKFLYFANRLVSKDLILSATTKFSK